MGRDLDHDQKMGKDRDKDRDDKMGWDLGDEVGLRGQEGHDRITAWPETTIRT